MKRYLPPAILRFIMYPIILLLGIYNAFIVSIAWGRVNADSTDTLMLWYGFKHYGWNFFKTWFYTPDNWFLSLLPFHILLFNVFPFSPGLMAFSGFFIFLLNVMVCGLIAKALKAKHSAILVMICLLFLNKFFFGNSIITFAITHNITSLFGLLTLLFAIYWIQYERKLALAVILFSMIVGGLSDPWFEPNYGIPMIIASIFMIIKSFRRTSVRPYCYLLLSLILALLIIYTRIFGFLSFLPRTSFLWAQSDKIIKNLTSITKTIGLFINFFPTESFWAAITSLIILLSMIFFLIYKSKKTFFTFSASQSFFFSMTICSIIIATLSYIFYQLAIIRYIYNIFILGIISLIIGTELNWNHFSKGIKVTFGILGLLYCFSGIHSTFSWWRHKPALPSSDYNELITILTKNHWTYGYGNYWDANVLSALSHQAVRVRPVEFDNENGQMYHNNRAQTSAYWYSPSDVSRDQETFFVYVHKIENINQQMKLYQEGLIKQYGSPSQIVHYKDGLIIVWNHPLQPLQY